MKIQRQSEINRINYLVQNNIHNFKNDFATFTNLVYEQDVPKLKEYNIFYGKYIKKNYDNWELPRISVQDELDAAENYFFSKKVRNDKLQLLKEIDLMAPESTLFLQSVLDTLIHNSITHGFLNKKEQCTILVKFYIEKSHLICIVQDNGKPPKSNDKYLNRPNSGLNLLKKRVENMYVQLHGKNYPDCFSVNSIPNMQGTQVKIMLPYEAV